MHDTSTSMTHEAGTRTAPTLSCVDAHVIGPANARRPAMPDHSLVAQTPTRRPPARVWDALRVDLLEERHTPRGKAKIGTYVAIVIGAALIILAYCGMTFGMGTDDKAVVLANVLAFDVVMITIVAAIVALAAYWEASGKPDLSVDLLMKFCEDNQPVLCVKPRRDLNWDYIDDRPGFEAELVVRNVSRYAARNPSVEVMLRGVSLLNDIPGWDVVGRANAGGATQLLWDGGADRLVHGRGLRKLPRLVFNGGLLLPGAPNTEIEVTLFADGAEPVRVMIPLRLLDREGWSCFMTEQSKRRGDAIPGWADASR